MDLYDILNIPPNASKDDIIKSYRKLAKQYHPDKPNGNTEKFQQINYAYNILINDDTKVQYDGMKITTKSKLTKFLEDWFKKQTHIKKFLNMSDIMVKDIMDNIETYDMNDILTLFSGMIIPTKKKIYSDCSDTETPIWEEDKAEYYHLNTLPLKYQQYNKNNIILELNCTLEDIINNSIRKIKINKKNNNIMIETSYYFKISHPYIVFNMGGDNSVGHLIINMILPHEYTWLPECILLNVNISLFQYIYGITNEQYNIINWVPYINGNIINIKKYNDYIFAIKLNTIYNDNEINKKILAGL